ncbi:tryptophanase [Aliarcobacter thereius]|uniref:Tryptophanase n=2 Tax=Aliarcobacter thereius TaxID=544718 RepID=A0A1C0BAB3_9BACT|nr:tryptophanase [Aliarcobacter thereius]OCL91818.1 Tyrosine phenol-lyase [Aliarcobacter thereius]OCL95084.1 Tyrosine phenol-lyase [Aliarcobacter thereius LMG 24486]OCM00536.1 Tyrosine phenol-lyase [Aliarcobacter thereius]QBF16925.1 tryptophanase [Aliarcobacter thereius LMG 24486]TLS72729.1 tryptophanase [Aliarcobacter thereius]
MGKIKFFSGENIPLEMHKVRIVQKLNLPCIEDRLKFIQEAGNNTFLLNNRDVFMDMLTDSGVNAMSDNQQSAMLIADDSYAGSETFTRLEKTLEDIFQTKYFLPAHQGRACENILAQVFVEKGTVVPMNYHFTTTMAHIVLNGGSIEEIVIDEGIKVTSKHPFKGNMDLDKLRAVIKSYGKDKVAFVRMEAGTNLIGGQPFSLQNLKDVKKICEENNLLLILDASLLSDNLHFIKQREEACKNMSIKEITQEMISLCDVTYFSARKLGFSRGGGICTNNKNLYMKMRELVTLYEGFLTYGGMSVREMEALRIGLEETMDEDIIGQGPLFIEYMVNELDKKGVPVITPAGGLGCHINAMEFVKHLPQSQYPAGALASALYIVSGVRGMERGSLSEQRDENGNEVFSNMELLRLAMPRRVFTLSQVKYAIDRIEWLYKNKELIGGLKFVEEPKTLRFFFGRLEATSNWQDELVKAFRKDFPDSL